MIDGNSKQRLGFWSIVLFGINGIIGSGIFLLPSAPMKLIGVGSVFALLLDAFLVATIALCFAQDANYFDKNGGPYLYAKEAFGNFIGYEVGVVTWAIRIIAEATVAVGFATILGAFFPNLSSSLARSAVIALLLIALALMNIAGVQLTKIINNIVTISKLIPLVLFISIGLFFLKGNNFVPFFPHGQYASGSFGQAALTMFFAFTGFEGISVAAGEMTNPKKNLPRAIMIIVATVTLVYVLIQLTAIGIMGYRLADSATPIMDAFAEVTGTFGKDLIAAGSLISIGGLLVASSFITPRSGLALAENKMMPQVIARKNSKNAPYVAIIISTSISLIIALFNSTFANLALISAISRFAQYIPTIIAVFVFSKTKKTQKTTFQIPFGPAIPLLALVVSIWLLVQTNIQQLVWGLGALVIAVPFYFFTAYRNQS
ncbi:amino acid permease [Oenococcus sicerae]|uniref:Amino acid permease n=1 Tax=Oenococcus sicerae TaxID=2203724 RepID=A0ABX5QNW0_9LACO|nr:APC family permease [Oenococcus sicerae]QAS70465.1 amino acid permease [Oenococcus sicerae]